MLLTHLFGSSGQEPAPNGLFDGSPPVVEGSAFREIMQGFQFAEEEGGSQTTGPYPSLADLIAQVIAQDGETAASGPHRMPSDFPQQGITAPPADAEPVTSDAPLSEARIAPPAKTETPSVPLERTALPPGDTHVFLPSTETSEFASDRPPSSNDVNVILPDEGAILQHRSEVGVDPPPPDPSGRPTDESAERDGQLPVPDHLDTAMVDAQRPEERATPVPKGGENIVEVTPNESDPPQRATGCRAHHRPGTVIHATPSRGSDHKTAGRDNEDGIVRSATVRSDNPAYRGYDPARRPQGPIRVRCTSGRNCRFDSLGWPRPPIGNRLGGRSGWKRPPTRIGLWIRKGTLSQCRASRTQAQHPSLRQST